MEQKVIEIVQGVTRHPLYRTKTPVDLCICKGEQIAIVGENGSGKTRLVDIITGKLPLLRNEVAYDFSPSPYPLISDNIKSITFRDSYGDHDGTYYYQQRWNQHDIDESVPTVGTLLEECFRNNCRQDEAGSRRKEELRDKLYRLFHLEELEDKRIITLSSGELRKFQLTKTLLAAPKVLIMDNPYIGLDSTAREQLTDLLKKLIAETDLQVILVLSRNSDIPDFITHVIPVKDLEVLPKTERNAFLEQNPESAHFDAHAIELMLSELQKDEKPEENLGGDILKFNNIHIQYGKRVILDQLNWQVKKGEKERLRKIHAAESGMRRQSAKLCLRHRAVRQKERNGREHLGHQETDRICQPRNAPRLPEGHAGTGHRGQRTERLGRSLCAPQTGTEGNLREMDGTVRYRSSEGQHFPENLQRRTAALPAGAGLCQEPSAAHPRRTAARAGSFQPRTGEIHHRKVCGESGQNADYGHSLCRRPPSGNHSRTGALQTGKPVRLTHM